MSVCGYFCSVVFSTLLCVRRCFVPLGAILFSFPFSFRDGRTDISDDARLFSFATFRATFACVAATRSAAFLTTPRGSTHRRQLSQT
jgi:hypothetical protein